jgi:hypothetical protein
MIDFDPKETGGKALTIGFLLVVSVLYRDPTSALETVTASFQSGLYFLAFPIAGILAGVYAHVGGAYSAVLMFLSGSYLGVFGLALMFGGLLSPDPIGLLVGTGIVILVLAVVTLTGSLLRLTAFFRFESLDVSSE